MTEPPDSSPDTLLTSWKAIAGLFGRDVRTVQRWEKEEGLPVHRHPHRRRSSVYAYRGQLNEWWHSRGAHLLQPADRVGPPARRPWGSRAAAGVPAVWWWAAAGLAVTVVAVLALRSRPALEPGRGDRVLVGTLERFALDGIASGDLNGDGRDDLIVEAGDGPELFVVFGSAGAATPAAFDRRADLSLAGPAGQSLMAARVLDLNGDGLNDLVVSVKLAEPASFHGSGPTYIIWGRKEWPARLSVPEAADVTIVLEGANDARLGSCFPPDAPMDLDRDGVPDLVLGAVEHIAFGRPSAGAVFVLRGRREWPRTLQLPGDASQAIYGSRMGEALGAVCVGGDLDGDRRTDLVVVAHEGALWNLLGSRGRVYGFLGGGAWPRVIDAAREFSFRVDGDGGGASLYPLATARISDVTGDGEGDLVVAWPHGGTRADPAGEVTIFHDRRRLTGVIPAREADVVIRGSVDGAALGAALSALDLDGDRAGDLVVAEAGTRRILLFYGRADWRAVRTASAADAVIASDVEVEGSASLVSRASAGALPSLVVGNGPPAATTIVERLALVRTLVVDVRPEYEDNVVLVPGPFVIRLTTADEDGVDPASVRAAGATPLRTVVRDFDGDGRDDVQAWFETSDLDLDPASRALWVTGRSRAGWPVRGADAVSVVRRDAVEGSAPAGAPASRARD